MRGLRACLSGATLIEVLITIGAISAIALISLPFVYEGKQFLRRTEFKQLCTTLVQNKLKDYRASKIWGINPEGSIQDSLDANSSQASGPYFSNSTFNWLKVRFNSVRNYGGCVDLKSIPAPINPYGLRENIDNHGSPSIPATDKACPEEATGVCQVSGIRDTLVKNQTGGNEFALFVNLQVVSRAQSPNPWSQFLTANDGSGQSLAEIYGTGSGAVSFTAGNCHAGLTGGYPTDVSDPVYKSSPYVQPPPTCPNPLNPYDFVVSNVAVRVIVTGAILIPIEGALGFTPDINLPEGKKSNRSLMCQAEEIIAPEESFVRFYVKSGNGIFDIRGNKVFQSIYSPPAFNVEPTALAVSPENSTVYVAFGSTITRYRSCRMGLFTSGVLDCDPDNTSSWNIEGIPQVKALGIDFFNFPDVLVLAERVTDTGVIAKDIRVNLDSDAICGDWAESYRIPQNLRGANRDLGGILFTTMNSVFLYYQAEKKVYSTEDSINLQYPFFQFPSDASALPAISQ